MHAAAAELQFELAARLRDEIKELKHELRGMLGRRRVARVLSPGGRRPARVPKAYYYVQAGLELAPAFRRGGRRR